MEKQLGWVCNLYGAEFLGISKEGQTALARFMESHRMYLLAGSVLGGFRKGTMAFAHLSV